jgi:predicted RNase H-like HicB family nuclease
MLFALAIHEEDGKFVTVPDPRGCFSAGDSLAEALEGAREAIDGHVELLIEEGLDVPVPAAIDDHFRDPAFADAKWFVLEVP